MPSRKRMSRSAPLASGVASVTVPDDIEELKPPPLGWLGGCSSVVPCTVTFEVPEPHGARSTVTTTAVEVRGRRSAMPEGAGKVVRSMMRQRMRVTLAPVKFVTERRMSSVPKVELFAVSDVNERTRFGGELLTTHGSSGSTPNEALRWMGLERFSGPGAPRR